MEADDFCSSDIEIPADPVDELQHLGRRSMGSIVEGSIADRISSKIAVKKLKDNAGAPGTIMQRRMWMNLFEQFAQSTLHLDRRADKTPTGADLLRFIAAIPDHLRGHNPHTTAISWSYIKSAEYNLEHALAFKYESFKLSKQDGMHLDAMLHDHLREGKLTKDPIRPKMWIGTSLIRTMVTALFEDAIKNGSTSWDVTVAKWLGLVLQAALCSRSGDFRLSEQWKDDKYLKWKDITIKARGNEHDPDLIATITLLYCKGSKDDPKKNMTVQLGQLPDSFSVVDPIKLLMAYALRIGAVSETSIDHLLDNMLRRPNKSLVWSKPNDPVFYAFKGSSIDFMRPATSRQQLHTLRQCADLVGLLQRPWSQDVRRGAASDVSSLKTPLQHTNTDAAMTALGHTNSTAHRGVTRTYIGRQKIDTWAARLEPGNLEDEDPFGPPIAPMPYKKPRLSSAAIGAKCDEMSLDASNATDRRRSRKAIIGESRQQWHDAQQSALEEPTIVSLDSSTSLNATKSTSFPAADPADYEDDEDAEVVGDLDAVSKATFLNMKQVAGLTEDTGRDEHNESLVEHALSAALAFASTDRSHPVLDRPIREFIGFVSRINVYLYSKISRLDTSGPSAVSGGSRDPPSRFVFQCPHAGCGRSFGIAGLRDVHANYCELRHGSPGEKQSAPSEPAGWNERLDAVRARRKDTTDFPKQCPNIDKCGVKAVYQDRGGLETHTARYHPQEPWPSTYCAVDGCDSTTLYERRDAYYQHLRVIHKLAPEQVVEYMDRVKPAGFKAVAGTSKGFLPTTCLYQDCKSSNTFDQYENYITHLKRIHKLSSDQYAQYMPTPETATPGTIAPIAESTGPLPRKFVAGAQSCTVSGCKSSTIFKTRESYTSHLSKLHNIDNGQYGLYMSGEEIIPYTPTTCQYQGCKSKRVYKTHAQFTAHLWGVHKVKAEDSAMYTVHTAKHGRDQQ